MNNQSNQSFLANKLKINKNYVKIIACLVERRG